MTFRLLRLVVLALLPVVLPGCLFGGVVCGIFGSVVQFKYPEEDICPLFDGDCCVEDAAKPYKCGAPNAAKTFPCGDLHTFGCGCATGKPSSQMSSEDDANERSVPITYLVPPFSFDLRFPFAGFDSAQHLAFPIVTNAFQTFHGTVTYTKGFGFKGFTALGPADTEIGSYGMDVKSTDTIDFAVPIRAASFDVAYVDVDLDGHQTAIDPTIVHHADTPGAGDHTFELALPAGGDTLKGFARSFLAFRAHVTLAAGILANPSTAGGYGVSGAFTSVDPDTGDADDHAGQSPISVAVPVTPLTIKASPLGLVDHFLCYKSKPSKGNVCSAAASVNRGALCASDAECGGVAGACAKNKLPKGVQAALGDRFSAFDPAATDVKKALRLCTPAAVGGAERHDAVTHLRGYQVALAKTAPKAIAHPNLAIVNQLGTIVIDVKAPDTLLVPVAKALGAPAAALGTNVVDFYQCYKAKLRTKRCAGAPARSCKSDLACGVDGPCVGKFPKGLQVSVEDQFTNGAKVFDVRKPTRLCTPALFDGSPIQSRDGQLMCYQVKPAAGAPKHAAVVGSIHTTGALGHDRLDTVSEDELCVPSLDPSTF